MLMIYCVQAVTNINTLLDKADRVYHQLMGHRPQLECLLSKVNEAAPEKPQVSLSVSASDRSMTFLSWITQMGFGCGVHVFMALDRMIQEQALVSVPPLPVSIGIFSSWHRNIAETARLHSMSSPKSSRLEINRAVTVPEW